MESNMSIIVDNDETSRKFFDNKESYVEQDIEKGEMTIGPLDDECFQLDGFKNRMEQIKTRCESPAPDDLMVKFSRQFLTQLADAIVQAHVNNDEDEQFMETIMQETIEAE